jgi:hypothetical protein
MHGKPLTDKHLTIMNGKKSKDLFYGDHVPHRQCSQYNFKRSNKHLKESKCFEHMIVLFHLQGFDRAGKN